MIQILFVGEGKVPMYELALFEAAKREDDLNPDIYTWDEIADNLRQTPIGRAEYKFALGPTINKINRNLIEYCEGHRFDIIFLYSCRLIKKETVSQLRQYTNYLATYNNDNPYSEFFPVYYWRHWRNSIMYFDTVYVYRYSNINDCKVDGAKNVKLLRSYYNENRVFYVPDENIDLEMPDVLFLGHHEADEREEYIRYLADNGIKVGIPDIDEWKGFERKNPNVCRLLNTHDMYNDMINKTKICLVFLSKINQDTYTRRCFEIPAVKTLMMSVYTNDIASMFEQDKEVVFFHDKKELLDKVIYYLKNDNDRHRICQAGFERVMRDKHCASDRVREIINDYILFTRGKNK